MFAQARSVFLATAVVVCALSLRATAEESTSRGPRPSVIEPASWLLHNLAFEEEKSGHGLRDDWYRARLDYNAGYGHPLRCAEDLFDGITLGDIDLLSAMRGYGNRLAYWAHLPFPLVWKLLDRQKPIRLSSLSSSFWFTSRAMPREKGFSAALAAMRVSSEEDARVQARKQGSISAPPRDALSFLKIALYQKIGKALGNDSTDWPKDWREKVVEELRRRFKQRCKTVDDWYVKEAVRQALVASNVSDAPELRLPVWQSAEFRKWWDSPEVKEWWESPKIRRWWESTEFKEWSGPKGPAPNVSAAVVDPEKTQEPVQTGWSGWTYALTILAGCLAISVVGAWLLLRRRSSVAGRPPR